MILATGGLLAASGASFAAPLCNTVTTVAGWAGLGATGCLDNSDSDSLWVWTGDSGIPSDVGFGLTEIEIAGVDFYTVALNWVTPSTTAATLSFTATILNSEQFIAANFGTTLSEATGTSGATASAFISEPGLTLTSTDGSQAPLSGETPFGSAFSSISVTDTFRPDLATPAGTALLTGSDNSFQVQTTPEPATLLLFGAALAGLGLVRRRKSS
jgi:hypothetical protein